MDALLSLLGLIGPLSIVVALIVVTRLSQRLGAVLHKPPIYRWFYLSIALILISIVGRLAALLTSFMPDDQAALLFDLPFVVGLIIAVVTAWRYWGWLLNERGEHTHRGA